MEDKKMTEFVNGQRVKVIAKERRDPVEIGDIGTIEDERVKFDIEREGMHGGKNGSLDMRYWNMCLSELELIS